MLVVGELVGFHQALATRFGEQILWVVGLHTNKTLEPVLRRTCLKW